MNEHNNDYNPHLIQDRDTFMQGYVINTVTQGEESNAWTDSKENITARLLCAICEGQHLWICFYLIVSFRYDCSISNLAKTDCIFIAFVTSFCIYDVLVKSLLSLLLLTTFNMMSSLIFSSMKWLHYSRGHLRRFTSCFRQRSAGFEAI